MNMLGIMKIGEEYSSPLNSDILFLITGGIEYTGDLGKATPNVTLWEMYCMISNYVD